MTPDPLGKPRLTVQGREQAGPDFFAQLIEDTLTEGTRREDTKPLEASLHEFTKEAFHIIRPGEEFIDNWHIEYICAYLQALTEGTLVTPGPPQEGGGEPCDNILINVPVGSSKSLLSCVFWPCWVWTRQPDRRWMFASYGRDLAADTSILRRRLVMSEWYQDRWGYKVFIRSDQNQKMSFENTHQGSMQATSVGGMATGKHPHYVVIDDPHSAAQAQSDTERQAAIDWYEGTIVSRGLGMGVKRAVIMQRLHEEDLSGHLLRKGGFTHICFPMFYEGDHRMERIPLTGYECDPRTEKDEMLWPDFMTMKKIEAMGMGPHVAAGQLQQRPSSLEGEFFKRAWFEAPGVFIPSSQVPRIHGLGDLGSYREYDDSAVQADEYGDARAMAQYAGQVVRYWDCAGTKDGGDYTVGVLMMHHSGLFYVLDMIRGQWEQDERDRIIERAAQSDSIMSHYYAVILEQEGGSAGKGWVQLMTRRLAGYRVEGHHPTGKKYTRADPWASQLASGNVRIVLDYGVKKWNLDFVDEHCAFRPDEGHAHDDIVDASAGAFTWLAKFAAGSDLLRFIDAGFF